LLPRRLQQHGATYTLHAENILHMVMLLLPSSRGKQGGGEVKIKIKCSLCLIYEAPFRENVWGSGSIAPRIFASAIDGGGLSVSPLPLSSRGKRPW
jgi:hypothetical protein